MVRVVLSLFAFFAAIAPLVAAEKATAPNVVLCIADDWGYPWAGAYGDPVVKTPHFDRVAREGALFTSAFVSSPSCTPSRGALLTGLHFWRLREGGNLWSTLPADFRTFPDRLAANGYLIGSHGKAWGPGKELAGGRERPAAGPRFPSFRKFLEDRAPGQPYFFWQGSSDPHRPYDWESGTKSGMDTAKLRLPGDLPDHSTTRTDVADYLWEVQRFDALVGETLAVLEERGELENTIVIVTGDHGMPFPRGKGNLYDLGTRVPLAVRWGAKIPAGQTVKELVSLVDLAPTILEAGGVKTADQLDGVSLLPRLTSATPLSRPSIVFGRERHTLSHPPTTEGYPSRAIRTAKHLLIWNLKPDRWPAGTAPDYRDCDAGPTKEFLIAYQTDPMWLASFNRAFARRPEWELYDVENDPAQLQNLAGSEPLREVESALREELKQRLTDTRDPRIVGGESFDSYPYYGNAGDMPKAKAAPARKRRQGAN